MLDPRHRPGWLLSYWYLRGRDPRALLVSLFGEDEWPELFLDSGAFTAYAKGEPISVEEYGGWLRLHAPLFGRYANLDVKGDWRESQRNQERLERWGLHPIPVFHGGEPWGLFEEMCAEHDYVALGGIVGIALRTHSPKALGWLDRAFEIAGDTKLHAFGISNWRVIRRYRWHSLDTTSWNAGFRYGRTMLFDPYRGIWKTFNKGHPDRDYGEWGWLLREYGFSRWQLGDLRSKETGQPELEGLLAKQWWRASEWLAERHGQAPAIYLAESGWNHLRRTEAAIRAQGERWAAAA